MKKKICSGENYAAMSSLIQKWMKHQHSIKNIHTMDTN